MVDDYKYHGVHIDNKLDWKTNTKAVYKKGMSRLFFLRKLRSFNVCSRMLGLFYQSVVASALYFAVVCLGSSIGAGNTNRLKKRIKKAGSVISNTFEAVLERRTLDKLLSILDNPAQLAENSLNSQCCSLLIVYDLAINLVT